MFSPGCKVLVPIGELAQLGERRPCKAEVTGSNPVFSTKRKRLGVKTFLFFDN